MGKFEFRKHGILLDIEGVQVTVPGRICKKAGGRRRENESLRRTVEGRKGCRKGD